MKFYNETYIIFDETDHIRPQLAKSIRFHPDQVVVDYDENGKPYVDAIDIYADPNYPFNEMIWNQLRDKYGEVPDGTLYVFIAKTEDGFCFTNGGYPGDDNCEIYLFDMASEVIGIEHTFSDEDRKMLFDKAKEWIDKAEGFLKEQVA